MKENKLTWVIAIIMLAFFTGLQPVYGGDADRIGTAAGEQLLIPVGARSLAMGGSNSAFTSGLEAIYWNPAGVARMDLNAAGSFSTMQIFNDVNVNYLAIGIKAGRAGVFGLSLKSLDFGDIPVTTNQDWTGASGETFSPTFLTGGLTYSRALTDAISVGATGKIVTEGVQEASATAFAFDIGIQYRDLGGLEGVSMGLAVKNVGTNLQYTGSAFTTPSTDAELGREEFRSRPTADHQLPATVELGVGYKRNINENNSVTLNGNFLNNNFGNDNFMFGVEYAFQDLIALRGGYRSVDNVESEEQLYDFTAGVGLHYQFGGTNLTFNYAFRNSEYFDGNNMFELNIGF